MEEVLQVLKPPAAES